MTAIATQPFTAIANGQHITVVGIRVYSDACQFIILSQEPDGTIVPKIVPSIRDLETEEPTDAR